MKIPSIYNKMEMETNEETNKISIKYCFKTCSFGNCDLPSTEKRLNRTYSIFQNSRSSLTPWRNANGTNKYAFLFSWMAAKMDVHIIPFY